MIFTERKRSVSQLAWVSLIVAMLKDYYHAGSISPESVSFVTKASSFLNPACSMAPIGLSRRDVDLLDIDDMRKAGMTSYQGRPLDEAMAELGGEERLEMAKVMESVYSAKSNYEDAQLKFLKVSGSAGASRAKKMDEAREAMEKSIGLAAGYGLDNELFEQAETTGWLSSLGNAIDRGMLMSEMSNYAPDFLTNTLDADEMQRFIEIASEMEKVPTSSTMKRYKESDKSGGFFEAIGKLLFDNTGAIPELFFESMSAFLPSTLKWLIPAGAGAAVGSVGGLPGMVAGAKVEPGLSFGTASFVLEASGMALESMQELNIDWKNPKVFAAAWTNESIRNKIQKKMIPEGYTYRHCGCYVRYDGGQGHGCS